MRRNRRPHVCTRIDFNYSLTSFYIKYHVIIKIDFAHVVFHYCQLAIRFHVNMILNSIILINAHELNPLIASNPYRRSFLVPSDNSRVRASS